MSHCGQNPIGDLCMDKESHVSYSGKLILINEVMVEIGHAPEGEERACGA